MLLDKGTSMFTLRNVLDPIFACHQYNRRKVECGLRAALHSQSKSHQIPWQRNSYNQHPLKALQFKEWVIYITPEIHWCPGKDHVGERLAIHF